MNKLLVINNLSKNYNTESGEISAIENISLEVMEGEAVAVVGSSGCGKSTLLSILASLDKQTEGEITFNKNVHVGYMLQQDALLPWLSIFDNVTIGLKINKLYDEEHIKYVNKLLKLYDLYDFKDKKPTSLSGGMKQRVALIRTLALKPDVLLLDEPFSALDYQTRLLICEDVYSICKREHITMIIVTHDLAEAISVAEKVVVLSKRPCYVKKIIPIEFSKKLSTIEKRNTEEFQKYYDMLWRSLDVII